MWCPAGFYCRALLFLLYINDLRFALKDAIASHFADDTCILYASNKLKSIETVLNCDLKSISEWLKSNRLSLNVDKSKLLMFKSKQRMLNSDSISIKLGGVKLIPADGVKYLSLHFDKYLSWDLQTNHISKKLSRANGILSKLRHFAKQTLVSVYYSILYTHLLYGCPVWSLTKKEKSRYYHNLANEVYANNTFCPFQQAYEQYVF